MHNNIISSRITFSQAKAHFKDLLFFYTWVGILAHIFWGVSNYYYWFELETLSVFCLNSFKIVWTIRSDCKFILKRGLQQICSHRRMCIITYYHYYSNPFLRLNLGNFKKIFCLNRLQYFTLPIRLNFQVEYNGKFLKCVQFRKFLV